MKTSGHTDDFISQVVEKGINAFNDKIKRSCLEETHPGFQPMFPKAGWRRELRDREKAMKKSTWYRGKDINENWEGVSRSRSDGRIGKRGKKKRIFQKDGKLK